MIVLETTDGVVEIAPELGGGVTRFVWRGKDVLRPTADGARDVLETACFPLVPFANRIAHGRFVHQGRAVCLEPNLGDHPHWLHGHGWRSGWSVGEVVADRAVLTLEHAADAWPWSYDAVQSIQLLDHGLRIELSLTNRSDEPMPAGLGFHPFFREREQAFLKASLDGVWLADAQQLPMAWTDAMALGAWPVGAALRQPYLVDHCHTGWNGAAEIFYSAECGLRLTASPDLGRLHVYSSPGETFFCVEPVSHRPDAVNAADPVGDGLRLLSPGETWTVWMALTPYTG